MQIDQDNWVHITDAMADVVSPIGTANSAHITGVDFAGKTGSAQVISNTLRKSKGFGGNQFKDNGWFVGVTPRRNPEIVVVVLIEQGEHGSVAAGLASKVIKAFVEKQRRVHNNPMLFSDKADPGSIPVAGVWNGPENHDAAEAQTQDSNQAEDHLHAATLRVKIGQAGKAAARQSSHALATILPGGQ